MSCRKSDILFKWFSFNSSNLWMFLLGYLGLYLIHALEEVSLLSQLVQCASEKVSSLLYFLFFFIPLSLQIVGAYQCVMRFVSLWESTSSQNALWPLTFTSHLTLPHYHRTEAFKRSNVPNMMFY